MPHAAQLDEKDPRGPHWQHAIVGRYRQLTVHQLAMLWWLYRQRHITARQLRIVFALHEMDERRSFVAKGKHRVLSAAELRRLIGSEGQGGSAPDAAVTTDLKRLCRLGLIRTDMHEVRFATSVDQLTAEIDLSGFWEFFAELPNSRRTVPVPRRLLRALAGGFGRAVTGTIIAYLIRCLFWHKSRSAYRVDGRAKATWIGATFGISRRAVIDARTRLVELGWLIELPATQWQLNKWGGRYAIDTSWSDRSTTESAPPHSENSADSAPPVKQVSSLSRENTETRKPTSGGPAGVSHKEKGADERTPCAHDIQPIDLRDPHRTDALYRDACTRGKAHSSEHGRLQFFSLVERARTRGHDPCRLLAWLVREQRFDFITQSDEDAAQDRIKRLDFGTEEDGGYRRSPGNWTGRGNAPKPAAASLRPSEDVCRYMAVMQVVGKSRTALSPSAVAREHLGWDSQRWDQAEADHWAWQRAKEEVSGASSVDAIFAR